ncbi:MAG: hypothetical protein K5900_05660 [Butyrivibrio sp.]|nr:hypothetical protein [Butyrivibrio sp.]
MPELKDYLISRSPLYYVLTVSAIIFLETLNGDMDFYIGQNVFFILQLLRFIFAVMIVRLISDYRKKYNNKEVKLILCSNVIFGVLAIICGIDWFVSAVSTMLSFYDVANYYIFVIIAENVFFFAGILLICLHRKNKTDTAIFTTLYTLCAITLFNLLYRVWTDTCGFSGPTLYTFFMLAVFLLHMYLILLSLGLSYELSGELQ